MSTDLRMNPIKCQCQHWNEDEVLFFAPQISFDFHDQIGGCSLFPFSEMYALNSAGDRSINIHLFVDSFYCFLLAFKFWF